LEALLSLLWAVVWLSWDASWADGGVAIVAVAIFV
jgi:hypothetical protein